MRLDRVYIDGFKNLNNLTADFDEERLTSVVIGQNGSGKSNLLEAITEVFRAVDLNRGEPRFKYSIDYRIGEHRVKLSNTGGAPVIAVDGRELTRASFESRKTDYFPDLVFGYYSGSSRRFERLFDSHQRRYYNTIKTNNDPEECRQALQERRLFYCRPIHGIFALLSFFAFPDRQVAELLESKLGITGYHSALALFREPWFYRSSGPKKTRKYSLQDAADLWGAEGPAGSCARSLRDTAFHPMTLEDKPIDDYRDKGETEVQFASFLRDSEALNRFATKYIDDRDMFAALEAVDISDLFRDLHLWINRSKDDSGDVGFADLSDGERQLLMVLGLIRISRGKRALFLLDEPDTHLNPMWQHGYLNLIRNWTGLVSEEGNCHIIMTSHNPLTISALLKQDVRVMFSDNEGVHVAAPYTDPKGMGFTATLTEIFGLPTTLDPDTQNLIDTRNVLARLVRRSEEQEVQLARINEQLDRLGFLFEDREPLYQDFLRATHEVRYADRPVLSPDQLKASHEMMRAVIRELTGKESAKP